MIMYWIRQLFGIKHPITKVEAVAIATVYFRERGWPKEEDIFGFRVEEEDIYWFRVRAFTELAFPRHSHLSVQIDARDGSIIPPKTKLRIGGKPKSERVSYR